VLLEDLVALHGDLLAKGAAVAPAGMAWRKVRGRLVIDRAGALVAVVPGDFAGDEPEETLAPVAPVRSVNIAAALLCDTAAYLLGYSPKGDAKAPRKFEAARDLHGTALRSVLEAAPVTAFFASWDPATAASHPAVAESPVDLDAGFLEFSLMDDDGTLTDILDMDGVRDALSTGSAGDGGAFTDLVTGEPCEPLRIHPKASALAGPGEKPAPVVGCNMESGQSWGAAQGYLSPMAPATAGRYSAALDWLLKDGGHNLRLGEASFVWWAEGEADGAVSAAVEDALAGRGIADVAEAASAAPLHVACLSSKYSRVQLRWYQTTTWGDAAASLTAWEGCFDGWLPSAFAILRASERPGEKHPATRCQDASSLVLALLMGGPWPRTLAQRAASSVALQGDVGHIPAGTLAAASLSTRKESDVETDDLLSPEDPAYRAGCIFAILEGLQKAALGHLAAPVRARFMAGAAKSPAKVMPALLGTAQAHLRKLSRLKPGLAAYYESTLSEAVAMGPVPLTMDAPASWRFYVGYYRQRDELYRSRGGFGEAPENAPDETPEDPAG
jgi:CRISPR-associated protein Csd1